MEINKLSLIVGGEAGEGITRSGFLFAKACLRGGLYAIGVNDYQSLIRGGHNFYIVRVGDEEIYSQRGTIDLLLALNKETILLHKDQLVSGGGIVYDGEEVELSDEDLNRDDLRIYSVPLKTIVKKAEGKRIMRNSVALGAALALLDLEIDPLKEVLEDTFNAEVADMNMKVAEQGFEYLRNNYEIDDFPYKLQKTNRAGKWRMFLTGNEAVGMGAIKAGCKFYAAYPMTPATDLLHFMASHQRDHGMVVMQSESEISAINMVAGASFAGVRAMTATSGGGFCLMSEGLGMTGMTENPVVIMVAQRPGPSTGLPTYSGQGDMRFIIHASQGEFPRVVIAPGDVEECFYKTMEAFNLAEKFQLPVLLVTDKYLVESHESVAPFDQDQVKIDRGLLLTEEEYTGTEPYKRHRFTEDGISLRAVPGSKGAIVRTNADEHDERGYTTEDLELTTQMNNKRFKKMEALTEELKKYDTTKFYGPEEAEATILGWGSTKGPIREALKILSREGAKVNYLQVVFLDPFPTEKVSSVLKSAAKTIVVENNVTSQLSGLIREHCLITVDHKILKYDGRPFDPYPLSRRIMELL
ncbi:MAG: 2-oxoacid:acceptor oxidoreductase subunit alpha [Thermoproteota archaeon]